jgi:hypothetical protein
MASCRFGVYEIWREGRWGLCAPVFVVITIDRRENAKGRQGGGAKGKGNARLSAENLLLLDQATSRSADTIAAAWVTGVLDTTIDAATAHLRPRS